MTALFERVRRLRNQAGEQIVEEHSPVGESQSNGTIGRAVREVQEMMARTLADLEASLRGRVPKKAQLLRGFRNVQQLL